MKILFVETGDVVQPKWVEPLRKKGWGVVRARSVEDASRMMAFHGDSLDAIAVGERFAAWAEKQGLPFVVMLSVWNETDVIKHQNGGNAAVAYVSFERGVDEVFALFESSETEQHLKATGTDGVPANATRAIHAKQNQNSDRTQVYEPTKQFTQLTQLRPAPAQAKPASAPPITKASAAPPVTKSGASQVTKVAPPAPSMTVKSATTATAAPSKPRDLKHGFELEDYSDILSKPEPTRAIAGTASLVLEAPTLVLGGKSAFEDSDSESKTQLNIEVPAEFLQKRAKPEVEEIVLLDPETASAPAPEPFVESPKDRTRTVLLEETSLEMDNSEIHDRTKLEILSPPGAIEATSVSDEAVVSVFDESALDLAPSEAEEALQVRVAPPTIPPPQQYAPNYSVPVNQFSINPNPGAQISDSETLRSYLALREQDVAVLTGQIRSSQERIHQLEMLVKMEKARCTELTHVVTRQEQQIANYDQEKQVELDVLGHQIDDMGEQLKNRTDKARSIEAKLRITIEEVAKIKERVRVDIRRIRVREKELESQLEVLKKDSSALLQARDEKILELKRKLDLLEFNMELVQEQFTKEKQTAEGLKAKLKDAAQVMKQAGGLLEQ